MSRTIVSSFAEGGLAARIFFRQLALPKARAQLLFVHGFGEHSGRYEATMRAVADSGFSSYAFDYRGHGRADGRRGHVNRFGEYLTDLDAAIALAHAKAPDLPMVLVGHSVGGLIVTHRIQRLLPDFVVGAALSSPSLGFKLKVAAWKDAVGQAAASLWPALTMSAGVDPNFLTHDSAVVAAYGADPLVVREVTARWYHEAEQAQKIALNGAGFIDRPLLVMQAGDDRIVDAEVVERFARTVPSAAFHQFTGLYHELFNETEPGRSEVLSTLVEFIDGLDGVDKTRPAN